MAAGGEGGEAPHLRLQVARKKTLHKAAGGEEEEASKTAGGERGRGFPRLQAARKKRLPKAAGDEEDEVTQGSRRRGWRCSDSR